MKKLRKSNNQVLTGVCGGIAEHYHVDPFYVRIITAALATCVPMVVFLYITASFIMDDPK